MRARKILTLAFLFFLPCLAPAQVTHGQKPKLPVPFATKSAGNGPSKRTPPAGVLPTGPQGFRVNVYATNFKRPRWLTAAPNGAVFLADVGSREIIAMRDPGHTGGAQEREDCLSDQKAPLCIASHEND